MSSLLLELLTYELYVKSKCLYSLATNNVLLPMPM